MQIMFAEYQVQKSCTLTGFEPMIFCFWGGCDGAETRRQVLRFDVESQHVDRQNVDRQNVDRQNVDRDNDDASNCRTFHKMWLILRRQEGDEQQGDQLSLLTNRPKVDQAHFLSKVPNM
jgi:hypothetical protein